MTNKKEIIVHGVDVSECEKLAPYNGYDEETKCNPSCCQNSPNCKYKQLKRKERECENLNVVTTTQRKTNIELTVRLGEMVLKNGNLYQLQKKYKQTLDEIEENIKAMNNECFYDDIFECNNCDMKNGCTYYRKFNILNIINKVKGGVNGNT